MSVKVKCPKCGEEFAITLQTQQTSKPQPSQSELTTPPDKLYKYYWRDEPGNPEYVNQEELKLKHPEACNPGEHNWHAAWQFGVYDCSRCRARRIVR